MDPASGRQPQGQVKVQAASGRALLGLSGSQTRTHKATRTTAAPFGVWPV